MVPLNLWEETAMWGMGMVPFPCPAAPGVPSFLVAGTDTWLVLRAG